jgi:hypothetical protein
MSIESSTRSVCAGSSGSTIMAAVKCLPRAGCACVLTVGTPCETTPSSPTPKAHLRARPIRPREVGQLDGRSAAGRPARDRPLRPEQLLRAHALRTQTPSLTAERAPTCYIGLLHVQRHAAQRYAEAAEAVQPKQCSETKPGSNCRAQPRRPRREDGTHDARECGGAWCRDSHFSQGVSFDLPPRSVSRRERSSRARWMRASSDGKRNACTPRL